MKWVLATLAHALCLGVSSTPCTLKDEVQELRQVSCHLSVIALMGRRGTTVLDLKPVVHEHREAGAGASSRAPGSQQQISRVQERVSRGRRGLQGDLLHSTAGVGRQQGLFSCHQVPRVVQVLEKTHKSQLDWAAPAEQTGVSCIVLVAPVCETQLTAGLG